MGHARLLSLPGGGDRDVDLPEFAGRSLRVKQDAAPEGLRWLDLQDPASQDLATLRDALDLHPLAFEDLERRGQRPKIDAYPGQYVIVAYEARTTSEGGLLRLQLVEIHVIAEPGLLATVHWADSPAVADARRRLAAGEERAARGVGGAVYELLDAIADGYFPVLDDFSERIDALQDEIFAGRSTNAALREILLLKRELLNLRRVVAPLRDVANTLLRRDVTLVHEEMGPYFQDLYDHLVRVLDTTDLYREMMAAALDANLAVTSNNLNIVVKRLTAFTVILMIPTLITGFYGMNFHNIPLFGTENGWLVTLVLMLGSIALLTAFFRWRDWL